MKFKEKAIYSMKCKEKTNHSINKKSMYSMKFKEKAIHSLKFKEKTIQVTNQSVNFPTLVWGLFAQKIVLRYFQFLIFLQYHNTLGI